ILAYCMLCTIYTNRYQHTCYYTQLLPIRSEYRRVGTHASYCFPSLFGNHTPTPSYSHIYHRPPLTSHYHIGLLYTVYHMYQHISSYMLLLPITPYCSHLLSRASYCFPSLFGPPTPTPSYSHIYHRPPLTSHYHIGLLYAVYHIYQQVPTYMLLHPITPYCSLLLSLAHSCLLLPPSHI